MSESPEFYINNVDYHLRDSIIVDPLAWERRWDIERFLTKPPESGCTLLDIGCGTGFFVKRAHDMGFDAYGLETDERAIESGRAYFGLETLYHATLSKFIAENQEKRFRIVTMFQVLEHLEQPLNVLQQVKNILEPGGVLVLSLPWRGRWPDVLGDVDLPPHHLTRWTEGALQSALERSGLRVRHMVFEDFPLLNMVGMVYHMVQKVAPFLTAAGRADDEKGVWNNVDSEEKVFRFLEKRRKKLTLALVASAPVWVALKVLGAKGPHMYVEAVLA